MITTNNKLDSSFRKMVEEMDEEQLSEVFTDIVGDGMNEFDYLMYHKGRKFVINYLCDIYDSKI